MGRFTDVTIALSIPTLILLYLSIAPYTKIEESFTIQATHDILSHGVPLQDRANYLAAHYDHVKYPELHPVPRTFIAPLALAAVASPFTLLVKGIDQQILVRASLGLYNAFCILSFRNSISKAFGSTTANWYIVFQAVQFHVIFYASRTLPNFIPFGLSTVALGLLLRPSPPSAVTSKSSTSQSATSVIATLNPAVIIFTTLGIVFRSELALLLATHSIFLLLNHRISLTTLIYSGILGAVLGLSLTIPFDTYLWQSPYSLWPELQSFLFNVIHGRSSDWGISPWHMYFTSSLPKLLFNPLLLLLCLPLSLSTPALRPSTIQLLAPNLAFIAIYSLQPHKEWRFIIYALPPFTAACARSAAWIWTRRAKTLAYKLLSLLLVFSTLISLALSLLFALISSLNYPGALALNTLHALADGSQRSISVHVDVLTAQTGATLFLELPSPPRAEPHLPFERQSVQQLAAKGREMGGAEETRGEGKTVWHYSNTDTKSLGGNGSQVLLDPVFWAQFDYALAERVEKVVGAWEVVASVSGYGGVRVLRPGDVEVADDDDECGWLVAKREVRERVEQRLRFYGAGPWDWWMGEARKTWVSFARWMRKKVTGGWWVDVKMVEVLHVLKRVSMEDVREELLKEVPP